MTARWRFYETPTGADPVRKEIVKCCLSKDELAKVQVAMNRVAEKRTRPGDVKYLRDGVREVRVRVANRQLRLLFAEATDGLILLALCFFQKQRQVEAHYIDLAVDRWRNWKTRNGMPVSPEGDMLATQEGGE